MIDEVLASLLTTFIILGPVISAENLTEENRVFLQVLAEYYLDPRRPGNGPLFI